MFASMVQEEGLYCVVFISSIEIESREVENWHNTKAHIPILAVELWYFVQRCRYAVGFGGRNT